MNEIEELAKIINHWYTTPGEIKSRDCAQAILDAGYRKMPEKMVEVIERDKYIAVRTRRLGLTAYGDTIEEATQKMKRMFVAWLDAHLKQARGER